ncbi:MAG: leucine-rich repeat protein [Ruminiclostridium sp.]|nr:leucine-rich repeat protein [Ruminiclostridium sp.]
MNLAKYTFGKFNNGGKLKKNIVRYVKRTISLGTALALTIGALPVSAAAETEAAVTEVAEAEIMSEIETAAETEATEFNVYEDSKAATSGDYVYIVVDGGAQITDYKGSATKLTIPSKINGYSVTSIGSFAFSDCTKLTSVIIPDSVTSIGYNAFNKCSGITSITIPNSVISIEDFAFDCCSNLKSITIGNSVKSIGYGVFQSCHNLTSITIPDSVTSIGESAFYYCTSLKSVIIGKGITSISKDLFEGCESLTSVTIPDSVTSIGNSAFYGCDGLKSITIPDSVTYIYSYAFGSCGLTSVVIPDKVTGIGSSAFSYCDNLERVTIGNSVKSIYAEAFYSCDNLSSIIIPDSVTNIAREAFAYCSALNDVYYTGTEEEWAEIDIGSMNNYLIYAPIHYNFKVPNFVERLYTKLLGRSADSNGKAKWVEKLISGSTAADVAKGFVLGAELKQQKINNRTFVRRMYETMLNRTPSSAEITNWASYLDAGCTYAFVFNGFVTAPEFSKLCASYGIKTGTYKVTENRDVNGKLTKFISRLYTKALNRTYDVSGLNHHTGNYISGKYTLDKIASGFIFSSEFEKRNLSDADFVECMYNTFFDRASDASGKTKWLQKMANGMTREEVFNGFVISPEYKALVKSFGL